MLEIFKMSSGKAGINLEYFKPRTCNHFAISMDDILPTGLFANPDISLVDMKKLVNLLTRIFILSL
jgi:hypothetical protein